VTFQNWAAWSVSGWGLRCRLGCWSTKWTDASVRASCSWKLPVIAGNGTKSCVGPRSLSVAGRWGAAARERCCRGQVGGRASTRCVLSEPLWTLSQVKGNGSLLGKVGAGDGNFTFLLFVLCLWLLSGVTALRVCAVQPRKSTWHAGVRHGCSRGCYGHFLVARGPELSEQLQRAPSSAGGHCVTQFESLNLCLL